MKKGLTLLLASAGVYLFRKVREHAQERPSFAETFQGIRIESEEQGLTLYARTDYRGLLLVHIKGPGFQHTWRGTPEEGQLELKLPDAPPGAYTFTISRVRTGSKLVSKKDVIRGAFSLGDEGNQQGND